MKMWPPTGGDEGTDGQIIAGCALEVFLVVVLVAAIVGAAFWLMS
jgi:hypothetical protein